MNIIFDSTYMAELIAMQILKNILIYKLSKCVSINSGSITKKKRHNLQRA